LPSQYILNRWTKYAKREISVNKQGTENENLTTQAARISRKATSIALKCSLSKELLDDLEKAIDKLDLDADNSICKVQEKANEVPTVFTECCTDTITGKISFRAPPVVKGPKNKRSTTSLEKRKGKKKVVTRKVLILPSFLMIFPLCSVPFNFLSVITCILDYRRCSK
jgi:hypothetical protein